WHCEGATGGDGGPGGVHRRTQRKREPMTATAALTTVSASLDRVRDRARTGGPKDDGPQLLEQLLGWTLVVLLAVLVSHTGLL
ncbi:SCO1431 family membrane protein, partial [Streptomyces sp. NPDC087850]|uniref:SCO1431 family membrane protein n=2 Tax=Streptomyces TaxID=1883 RepID=UPI00380AD6E0